MNQVAQQLQKRNPINDTIAKIRAGEIDPKVEVMKALRSSTPQQKAKIRGLLPVMQNVAKRAGFPVSEISLFTQEVTANLS